MKHEGTAEYWEIQRIKIKTKNKKQKTKNKKEKTTCGQKHSFCGHDRRTA